MPTVEQSIDIRAPIEEVFDAITDPRRTPEWNTSITEVSGVTYPMQTGSTWSQTVMVAGRPVKLNCKVTRYERPHDGEVEVSGDQRGYIWTRCASLDGSTRVVQRVEYEPPGGMLGRMMGGMISGMVEKELRQTLTRLRDTLESEDGVVRGSGA